MGNHSTSKDRHQEPLSELDIMQTHTSYQRYATQRSYSSRGAPVIDIVSDCHQCAAMEGKDRRVKVHTRVGVLEVDLALDGRTDCHDIHHLSIVSGPGEGQSKHGGAPSDERPHWRLSAAAALQDTHTLSKEAAWLSSFHHRVCTRERKQAFLQRCLSGCDWGGCTHFTLP